MVTSELLKALPTATWKHVASSWKNSVKLSTLFVFTMLQVLRDLNVQTEEFKDHWLHAWLALILTYKSLFTSNCGAENAQNQTCRFIPWISQQLPLAAAAAKSLQSCPTLCDSRDSSPPGSPGPGILQARTLEWLAISFSNAWKWKVKVKSLSRVRLYVTP